MNLETIIEDRLWDAVKENYENSGTVNLIV
jgi:hypothetical protein